MTTRLLFQPAEEGSKDNKGGAEIVIKEGFLDDVDEVYGFHNMPTFKIGKFVTKNGPFMACVTTIKIVIIGMSGLC